MRIVAYGKPITQGSKTRTRWGMKDDNADTLKPWRALVHHAALDVIGTQPRIEDPVNVEITFYFDRPRGHYRTGKNAHLLRENAPVYPATKNSGDLDKLQRACFDSLTTAGVWCDDALVVHVNARKVFCDSSMPKPGVVIDILPAVMQGVA